MDLSLRKREKFGIFGIPFATCTDRSSSLSSAAAAADISRGKKREEKKEVVRYELGQETKACNSKRCNKHSYLFPLPVFPLPSGLLHFYSSDTHRLHLHIRYERKEQTSPAEQQCVTLAREIRECALLFYFSHFHHHRVSDSSIFSIRCARSKSIIILGK